MVGNEQWNAAVAMHAAAKTCNRSLDVEQCGRRALAKRYDQGWFDQLDLAVEVRSAGLRLRRFGRAISRWPAFEDVGNVDVRAALHAQGREHVVEQSPGLADEGFALGIFFRAGRLADEEPLCFRIAHSRNRFVARPADRKSTRLN